MRFAATTIASTIAGGVLVWVFYHVLKWQLGWVFLLLVLRACVQALFVPPMLTIKLDNKVILGPKAWWYDTAVVPLESVDSDRTRLLGDRFFIADHQNQIHGRLGWYRPEDRRLIKRLVADLKRS
ncbi:MAG: hypothetical protein AAGI48_10725 [Verrucomicrobiota bacterium]